MEEEELFLPVLSHFENGNFWTASAGALRYRVDPVTQEGSDPTLHVQVWEGPWCLQDSTVEETGDFPMREEGLAELSAFLCRWRSEMNARPKKSLEETIRLRDQRRQAREQAE